MTQIDPINWQLALLTHNPFLRVPPTRPEDVIWAGFSNQKKQLDAVFTEAFSSSRAQVLLIRGERGSGKTHIATFCRRKEYLDQFQGQTQAQVKPFELIYTRTPDEPEKGDIMLYQSVLEALRFRNVRALVKSTILELGSDAALAKLQEFAESEPLGHALWLLGYEKTRSGQLTLFQDEDIGSNYHKLLERYFYSLATKGDLKRLGLSHSIVTARDRFQLLTAIFRCLIEFGDNAEGRRRLILWIDEIEGLINYEYYYYLPFTHGLRDLIDHLPSNFTLLMNFVLASDYRSSEDVRTLLGRALAERVTKQIYLDEPSEDEAFEYIKDLMRQCRTENFEQSGLLATYPFHEDALRLLITNLYFRTPRRINLCCAYIIEEALMRGIIHGAGEGAIDMQFVRSLEDECRELEMR